MYDVRISRMHFPVTTLGPGRRVGIWFQGCSIHCPGCISVDTWPQRGGETTVDEVIRGVAPWLEKADGVTISGGEPFDQAIALKALLDHLKRHEEKDVLVYSGYAYESLTPYLASMPGKIDALITDPFEVSTSQTLPLRGSDNQRLHLLTPLGRQRFRGVENAPIEREQSLDMVAGGDAVWLVGIPSRGDLDALCALIDGEGGSASTTEHHPRNRQKRSRRQ